MNSVRVLAIGILLVSLSGCSLIRPQDGEGVAASALPYRASIDRGEDRRDVSVTVRASGATVDEVRESARFPVTRYCLSTFGGSDADWTMDPVTGDWAVSREGETMIFSARCTSW